MKNYMLIIAVTLGLFGCKYNDDYLNPRLDETLAYFASSKTYTRTLIVGEGLEFRIGAAMAGMIQNPNDQMVKMIIPQNTLTDGKELLPKTYYNSDELNGEIVATIPKGEFLGYFTVKIDSAKFLSDPESLTGKYAIPVKIIDTSLDAINEELDSVLISIRYMNNIEGYYLYESTIRKEINGTILNDKTVNEKYPNESDNSVWTLKTVDPFTVQAQSAVNAPSTNGLAFELTLQNNTITYGQASGQPLVEADGSNTYDPKTRDFALNYKYQINGNDTLYHVSTHLIFRNRMIDHVNQTREYLSHFN